jgi:hypothetical protein
MRLIQHAETTSRGPGKRCGYGPDQGDRCDKSRTCLNMPPSSFVRLAHGSHESQLLYLNFISTARGNVWPKDSPESWCWVCWYW